MQLFVRAPALLFLFAFSLLCSSRAVALEPICDGPFIRGDVDGDGQYVALVDGLYLLMWYFASGPEPDCFDRADVNDDESVQGLVDALALLNYTFVPGSEPPAAPFPAAAFDEPCDGIDNDGDIYIDEGCPGSCAATSFATWEEVLGGTDNDRARAILPADDCGYLIAGDTLSYGAGSTDMYLVKIDALGQQDWTVTLGGMDPESAYDLSQNINGYVIAGTASNAPAGFGVEDGYAAWIAADGNVLFEQYYGGGGRDTIYDAEATSDDGMIFVGATDSFGAGNGDVFLIKTDEVGNQLWARQFGLSETEYGTKVRQTSDGGYIIAATTESYGNGDQNIYLIKTDADGVEEWSQVYLSNGSEEANDVLEVENSGYIIVGQTNSFGFGGTDIYVIRTDLAGDVEWNEVFGSSWNDTGTSIIAVNADVDYVVVGSMSVAQNNRDLAILGLDDNGAEQWTQTYGGSENDSAADVLQSDVGYLVVPGTTRSFGAGDMDAYVLKVDPDGML